MAQKVSIVIECDLDETEAREATTTVFFDPKNGQRYELDVCNEHAGQLSETLDLVEGFVHLARKAGGPTPATTSKRGKSKSSDSTNSADPKSVREWAYANGIDVAQRGRLAESILEQYAAAH